MILHLEEQYCLKSRILRSEMINAIFHSQIYRLKERVVLYSIHQPHQIIMNENVDDPSTDVMRLQNRNEETIHYLMIEAIRGIENCPLAIDHLEETIQVETIVFQLIEHLEEAKDLTANRAAEEEIRRIDRAAEEEIRRIDREEEEIRRIDREEEEEIRRIDRAAEEEIRRIDREEEEIQVRNETDQTVV